MINKRFDDVCRCTHACIAPPPPGQQMPFRPKHARMLMAQEYYSTLNLKVIERGPITNHCLTKIAEFNLQWQTPK